MNSLVLNEWDREDVIPRLTEYKSIEDFIDKIYDLELPTLEDKPRVHAVTFHPNYKDGILVDYSFRLFDDEYKVLAIGELGVLTDDSHEIVLGEDPFDV